MSKNPPTIYASIALLSALFLTGVCPASAQDAAAKRQTWEIPVRVFLGYSDEEEQQIVRDSISSHPQKDGPLFRFSGEHYWSRRMKDQSVKSRLDLWVWEAPRDGAPLQILIFSRWVDPLVRLDPNLTLPAELTKAGEAVTAVMAPTERQYNDFECRISVPTNLIPGRQRVYLVDTSTGWWNSRDILVSIGQ